MTILGVSKDPVFIKKIALRIWTLRDEIEAIIAKKIADAGGNSNNFALDELKQEYSFHRVGETTELHPQSEMAPAAEAIAEGTGHTPEAPLEASISKLNQTIHQRRPQVANDKIISAAMFLSEISMENIYFFAGKELVIGQSVIVEFIVPKKFLMNGIINYCHAYNIGGRIISSNRLPYRMGLKFTFSRRGERTILRQFIKSIEPDIVKTPTATEPAEKKSGESFDELDSLEF